MWKSFFIKYTQFNKNTKYYLYAHVKWNDKKKIVMARRFSHFLCIETLKTHVNSLTYPQQRKQWKKNRNLFKIHNETKWKFEIAKRSRSFVHCVQGQERRKKIVEGRLKLQNEQMESKFSLLCAFEQCKNSFSLSSSFVLLDKICTVRWCGWFWSDFRFSLACMCTLFSVDIFKSDFMSR